jgi:hypothetical protein
MNCACLWTELLSSQKLNQPAIVFYLRAEGGEVRTRSLKGKGREGSDFAYHCRGAKMLCVSVLTVR